MGVVLSLTDKLASFVSGLGTGRDKASSAVYLQPLMTDEQLIAMYRGSWLARKIVDIPALDSCRKWRDWQAEDDQIEKIEAEENRLNLRGKIMEARTKARLFGGAAVMIGTGDLNTLEPLDYERIGLGGLRYLTVIPKSQLTGGDLDYDPASEWYGKSLWYELRGQNGRDLKIHPSRLVLFNGATVADDMMMPLERGWGESILTATSDAITNADGTAANIASLIYEAKVDVIKVPNLMSQYMANPAEEKKLLHRFALAATAKGNNGMIILDGDEDYQQKSASFATLPDIMRTFLEMAAGAADIPTTRLLGTSPGGMNATGESDVRNYYDRIQATQTIEVTPAMHRLDECLIRSALGERDPDIHYSWSSLWQVSDKEKADIFKTKSDAARSIAGGSGQQPLMPLEALSDALVNAFVEDGSLPGLEAAIDEYGKLSEQEEDDDDLEAATGEHPVAEVRRVRMAANDAAPKPLYVHRKVKNGAAILRWAKSQGFTSTLDADDLHVTIAYSKQAVDWMAVGESWEDEIRISAGGPRIMEQFGEATVLLIPARSLKWRHQEIIEAGASWDHQDFQPHITISYGGAPTDLDKVEPYQGPIILGPEIFEPLDENWKAKITEE